MKHPEPDTRRRLLDATAELIASSPGEDFSLRAVCDAVGVKMPTLYHFFGSKQGLLNAAIERGFDRYLEAKASTPSSGDPIHDIRAGWDTHVTFGLHNPGFYTLMYGKTRPGHAPAAQQRPELMLLSLLEQAARQGRLVVPPQQATAHILATNIGVTLRQIVLATPDPALSSAVRDGVIASITGAGGDSSAALTTTIELAAAAPKILGQAETHLLLTWLQKLREHHQQGSSS